MTSYTLYDGNNYDNDKGTLRNQVLLTMKDIIQLLT